MLWLNIGIIPIEMVDEWNWDIVFGNTSVNESLDRIEVLSRNYSRIYPTLTVKMIYEYRIHEYIDWTSYSSYCPIQEVLQNPREKWDLCRLSFREDITVEITQLELPNSVGSWSWSDISAVIDVEEVIKYPNLRWRKNSLSHNKRICTRLLLLDLPNSKYEWMPDQISRYLNYRDILLYDIVYDRRHLSLNRSICVDMIYSFIRSQGEWNWNHISYYISMEDVINHPDLPWNRESLSMNKKICIDVVITYLPNATNDWRWNYISQYIKIEDVRNHPHLPWNKDKLSYNENMKIDILSISLPNATGEWNNNLYRYMDIADFRILRTSRENLSNCRNLSIYWIDIIDRVGIKWSRWTYDIDFLFL